MKLQRLRIDQVRQFRKPLEVRDLSPGINLFTGPNESGKSTMVRAIRAAFFERHRSGSVDDLRPWGDSSAAPQVEVDFDFDGKVWRLAKAFLKKARCDLSVDGKAIVGADAEDLLAQMLGFEYALKGASQSRHWGIPGLLWIEQGDGQNIKSSVEFAADHLKSVLGASVGEVASSAGDELIAQVESQKGALVTSTGKPRGDYANAISECGTLTTKLQELDGKISSYQQQVDRLGLLRAQQRDDDASRPWEALTAQLNAARDLLEQVDGLSELLETESAALDACRRNIDLVDGQLKTFDRQARDLAKREIDDQQARKKLEDLGEQDDALRIALSQAKAEFDAARETERKSRAKEQRSTLLREQKQLQKQLAATEDSVKAAMQADTELQKIRKELVGTRLDAKVLRRLKTVTGELREAEIRLQSTATRLEFDLLSGQSIRLGDEVLSEIGERLLAERTDVHIEGIGRLTILPGGEDLGELSRKRDRLRNDCQSLLKDLQVESLAVAEQRAERTKELEALIKSQEAIPESRAPDGITALEEDMATQGKTLKDIETRLSDFPDAGAAGLPSVKAAEAKLAEAEVRLKEAESSSAEHRDNKTRADVVAKSARDEFNNMTTALADPKRDGQQRDNLVRFNTLKIEAESRQTTLDDLKQRIAEARPDILRQDIQRFDLSAAQTRDVFDRRTVDIARLESELSVLGAQGLAEERTSLVAESQSANRRHDEMKRRSEALLLLSELLNEKRKALTELLQLPLQARINHYLQLLFPHATLLVDENLIPVSLARAGSNGPDVGSFDDLSFGAREQMGLISRLAYADLLKDAGRPTLIILDDALVHSDQARLAQMKRILFDAAQRHQILLFTCHPDNWRDLGVVPRDLPSLKAGAS